MVLLFQAVHSSKMSSRKAIRTFFCLLIENIKTYRFSEATQFRSNILHKQETAQEPTTGKYGRILFVHYSPSYAEQ